MKNAFVVFVVALFAFGNEARSEDVGGLKRNQSTLALLNSEPGRAGNVREIANAVNRTNGLRARPIVGHDSFQSINGMLFLRSIDLALLSSDSLGHVKQVKLHDDETGKFVYLVKLANSNVMVLLRNEHGANQGLPGIRIATDRANSDEFKTGELVIGGLGTSCRRFATRGNSSLAALPDGCVDAAVFTVAGLHTLLNSGWANGGPVFSIHVAGSQ